MAHQATPKKAPCPLSFTEAVRIGDAFLRPRKLPVMKGVLKQAILTALGDAGATFLCSSRPVWTGWASAHSILWRLPVEIAGRRYIYAEPGTRDFEAGCYVLPMCLEMAGDGEIDVMNTKPLGSHLHPVAASIEDWNFRLPGYDGCCYWEPSRPSELTVNDRWYDLVAASHLAALQEQIGTDPHLVPLYVLARIERARLVQRTPQGYPRRVMLS